MNSTQKTTVFLLPFSNAPLLISMASVWSATKTMFFSRINVSLLSPNAKIMTIKFLSAFHATQPINLPITPAYSSIARHSPTIINVSVVSMNTTSMRMVYANASIYPTVSNSTNNKNASDVLQITRSIPMNAFLHHNLLSAHPTITP